MLKMCCLRVVQEAGGDGKCRPLCLLRKSSDAKRPADPHRTAQNFSRKPGQTSELTAAAGQHHASAWLGREWRRRKLVANHFEDFLDARLDDAHELGARD